MKNQVFGRLMVLERDSDSGRWLCKCECGNIVSVRGDHLKDGHVKSCGCLSSESSKKRFTKHGMCYSRIYGIWVGMRQRCGNPRSTSYVEYGGRGIEVCKEWNDFETFYNWAIENGYSDELSIDRINNDGNYEPLNCRWATTAQQERNKRTNRVVDADGNEMILKDYCDKYSLPYHMILKRLLRGWEVSDAITIPSLRRQGVMKKSTSEFIEKLWKDEERLDKVAESVCPNWWHCRTEQAVNGTIDTFSCREHYCTDLLIIQPYGEIFLKDVLTARCKSANEQGDLPCSLFERRRRP